MKTNSRNPVIRLRPLGILVAWAALNIGSIMAQTTISSAEVDLYHSAIVVDGPLDVDNPPATSTFGVDTWSGSAFSSGIGSYSSNGNKCGPACSPRLQHFAFPPAQNPHQVLNSYNP